MPNQFNECSSELLINLYFKAGLQHKEILSFLALRHNILLSGRQLRRILKRLKLYRKKHFSSLRKVVEFIETQIKGSGQLHGYRWMHLKCIQNGLVVTQETVRILLQHLDPEGASFRRRKRLQRREYFNKGPNYLWHIDGYDKLKPYGIAISGCIDGFSRYIIWLRAGYTNNNPRVVSGYYINAIKSLNGICPRTVRTDFGTENKFIEHMQSLLRENLSAENNIVLPAIIKGTSCHNQRIEAWWAILRKENAQFWMNLFEGLKDANHFNGSFIDKALIQFCFLHLIQEELDTVALEWNSHRITSAKNGRCPSGKPVIMFQLPSLYDCIDYGIRVPTAEISACEQECLFVDGLPQDKDVLGVCKIIMDENGYQMPKTAMQAADVYCKLRNKLTQLLM